MDINNLLGIGAPITLMMMRLTGWKYFRQHSQKMFSALFLFAAISTGIFYLLSFKPLFLLTWFGFFSVVPLSCFGGCKLADKLMPEAPEEGEPTGVERALSFAGGIFHLALGIAALLFLRGAKADVLLRNEDSRVTTISTVLYWLLIAQYWVLNPVWKQMIEWIKRK